MLWHVIAKYGQDGLPSELITEPLQATGNLGPSYFIVVISHGRPHKVTTENNLPRQCRRRPADIPPDGPLLSTAQPAARAVLPPEQLAQSARSDQR
jgi:hypothetical protein